MTTLSQFQQSELKRFELAIDTYDSLESGNQEEFQMGRKHLKDSFISAIEKAYALGREEKRKEIKAKITKKDFTKTLGKTFTSGYNSSVISIRNLLKNK